jgi:hypothetical protein
VDLPKLVPLAIALREGGLPVTANAASFPIEETSIAALQLAYLSGRPDGGVCLPSATLMINRLPRPAAASRCWPVWARRMI